MKKMLAALCFACALTLTLQAGEGKKPEMTAEQKAFWKEIVAKYDASKDGKLDKEEKAKISAEDKATIEKAGLGHKLTKAAKDGCCAKSQTCQ